MNLSWEVNSAALRWIQTRFPSHMNGSCIFELGKCLFTHSSSDLFLFCLFFDELETNKPCDKCNIYYTVAYQQVRTSNCQTLFKFKVITSRVLHGIMDLTSYSFTYNIIASFNTINLCIPKGHLHKFTSWTWCGRWFFIAAAFFTARVEAGSLWCLRVVVVWGHIWVEGSWTFNQCRQGLRLPAPTDLPGRCWLLRWVSFMPRQHPSLTQSVLSHRVIVLFGPTREARPERGHRRLRLTAGGRNWADVSFKVGHGRKMLSPSATELKCVCEWERVRLSSPVKLAHLCRGPRHLDFRERSTFRALQLVSRCSAESFSVPWKRCAVYHPESVQNVLWGAAAALNSAFEASERPVEFCQVVVNLAVNNQIHTSMTFVRAPPLSLSCVHWGG